MDSCFQERKSSKHCFSVVKTRKAKKHFFFNSKVDHRYDRLFLQKLHFDTKTSDLDSKSKLESKHKIILKIETL